MRTLMFSGVRESRHRLMHERAAPSHQSGQSVSAISPSARRDVRVLIVDDSAPFRNAARELLERRGYQVIGEATSLSEAMQAIDSHPPDAVLVDVRLGEESGGVVAAYLQARYPAVAVLLVSAGAQDAFDHLDADASGAFGPIDKAQLARIDLTQYWPAPSARHN